MAKKEIRINFNLDNENEKELYEFLLSKTSASGYLKDLALDVIHGTGGRGTHTVSSSDDVTGITAALQAINSTLSNLKIIANNTVDESAITEDDRIINSDNVKELVLEADDLDF